MNYESANGTLPPGACSSIDYVKNYYRDNFSSFVRILPYTEQAAIYNSVNMSMTYANVENRTIAGVQVASLVCPSDINNGPQMINTANGFGSSFDGVTATGTMLQYFCSYGGSQGTFWSNYYIGAKGGTQVQTQQNGTIIIDGNVTLASITDGTSNTFIYGEKAHGYLRSSTTTRMTPSRGKPAFILTPCSLRPIRPTCRRRNCAGTDARRIQVLFRDRRDELSRRRM